MMSFWALGCSVSRAELEKRMSDENCYEDHDFGVFYFLDFAWSLFEQTNLKSYRFCRNHLLVSGIKTFAGIPVLHVDIESITNESTAYYCVPSTQKKFIDSK